MYSSDIMTALSWESNPPMWVIRVIRVVVVVMVVRVVVVVRVLGLVGQMREVGVGMRCWVLGA